MPRTNIHLHPGGNDEGAEGDHAVLSGAMATHTRATPATHQAQPKQIILQEGAMLQEDCGLSYGPRTAWMRRKQDRAPSCKK